VTKFLEGRHSHHRVWTLAKLNLATFALDSHEILRLEDTPAPVVCSSGRQDFASFWSGPVPVVGKLVRNESLANGVQRLLRCRWIG